LCKIESCENIEIVVKLKRVLVSTCNKMAKGVAILQSIKAIIYEKYLISVAK